MEFVLNQLGKIMIQLQENDKNAHQLFDELIYGKSILIYDLENKSQIQSHLYLNQRNPEMIICMQETGKRYVLDFRLVKVYRSDIYLEMNHQIKDLQYLVIREGKQQLIIIFGHKQDKQKFVKGLRVLINKMQGLQSEFDPLILKNFIKADTNQNMELSKDELKGLLADLKRQYDQQIKGVIKFVKKTNQDEHITYKDFEKLAKILSCRTEMLEVFQKYTQIRCTYYDYYLQKIMSRENFRVFLEYQQLVKNPKQVQYYTTNVFGNNPKICFYEFCQYLLSPINTAIDSSIFNYQEDQSKTLIDYYCYSSHNTYLTGNQLTSDSKAARYWEDLQDGIRCVEIDTHDDQDYPIVKHGFTMTSAISFQEVVKVINRFSEEHKGHTPIILSIQNHCNNKNQLKMAHIMEENFKQKILIIQDARANFPTLSECRNRIIIKSSGNLTSFNKNIKKNNQYEQNSQIDIESDNSDGQYEGQEKLKTVFNMISLITDYPTTFLEQKKLFDQQIFYLKKEKSEFIQHQKVIHDFIKSSFNMHQVQQGKHKLNLRMLSLTSMLGSGKLGNPSPWESVSISQSKFVKYFDNQKERLIMLAHSKAGWLRSYPLASRVDSSNYNPIPVLQMGVQIIALNTQSTDPYTLMMKRFFDKGKSKAAGYRLKSNQIYSEDAIPSSTIIKKKTLTILSASKIYQNKPINSIPGIQVKLSFIGSSKDMQLNREQSKHSAYTQLVKGNAFNPVFKSVKRFTVRYSLQMFAFIFVEIQKCGISILPLQNLKSGYRVISLYDDELHLKESKLLCLIQ